MIAKTWNEVGTEPSSDADNIDLFGLDFGDDSTVTINSVTELNETELVVETN